MMVQLPEGMPPARMKEQLRRFAEEVMPAFGPARTRAVDVRG